MKLAKFKGSLDQPLVGWLHAPKGPPRAALVLAHCFTCSKDLGLYRFLGQELARQGFVLLRFDFTGIGQSQGEFSQTTLETNVQDLKLALAHLRQVAGALPVGVIGHSLGGTAALLATKDSPDVGAAAVLATSSEPGDLKRLLGARVQPDQGDGTYSVTVAGREFKLGPPFFQVLERLNLLAEVSTLQKPLLLVHGRADRLLPPEHAEKIHQAAPGPKKLVLLDGADHLFSAEPHRQELVTLLGQWFEAQLLAG